MRALRTTLAVGLLLGLAVRGAPASAQAARPGLTPAQQLARDIYEQLVEINTTNSVGDNTEAARAMARRLLDAGFPAADVHVVVPDSFPKKGNLVARLRGSAATRKPILLLAHLDVVEADPADWTMDPFTLNEDSVFFYGRGTSDDKAMAAIWVANLVRYKQQGFRPDRDIVLALTSDEEGGPANGVHWLLENHPELVGDVAFGLNEGGGGELQDGRPVANRVGAAERIYQDFTLEVTNPGGHSSVPRPDNAIYQLAAALQNIQAYRFPAALNEVSRGYFAAMAGIEKGDVADLMRRVSHDPPDAAAVTELSKTPYYNALLHTTCVATMLSAGHAPNALPQRATANVNCRMLPGSDPAQVLATLRRVVADSAVHVTPVAPAKPSPPSPLTPEIMRPIERLTKAMWPGAAVVPVMGTGATDGLYFRQKGIPVYGVSGLFMGAGEANAHGMNEKMRVKSFYDGLEFLYRLVRSYATPST